MNSDQERRRTLFEIEAQIMEEGREWTRKRLQEELQKEAERDGGIFPPQRPKAKTSAGGANATAHRRRGR
jgi:hypothetical protein